MRAACPRMSVRLVLCAAMTSMAAAAADRAPVVRLAAFEYRPREDRAATPPWFAADEVERSTKGRRYLVVTASRDWTEEHRDALVRAGAEILEYLPDRSYRIRVAPGDEARVRALPFLAWVGVLPPHGKVSPALAREAGRPERAVRVRVILAPDETPERVVHALAAGRPVALPSGRNGAWRVEANLPAPALAAALARAAALPEVEAVEPVRLLRPQNQDAVWVHQSFIGPSPQETPLFDHGIFGCGETVAVADTGQDWDLCFFRDALGAPPVASCTTPPCPAAASDVARRKDVRYYNWSGTALGDDDTCSATIGASGHGTHTSGTIAGDMAPYVDCVGYTSAGRNGGDGVAPGGKLVVQEMGDGLEYLNALGGTLWNLADVAWQTGARVHSNSWGAACHDLFGSCIPGCTMPYDSFARDADLAMWTHPDLLLVISAGNAGELCPAPIAIGTPAIAKNPVTVAALGHGPAATGTASFSSPGPVFDGRLKPTLAAQGEATVSAASDPLTTDNCDTCALDGTSMAAPTVAGLAAQVREYYRQGFHVDGTRDPTSALEPTAALVKATLIDSAVPLGPAAPGPDFESGFGRVQLDRTLAFPGGGFVLRVDDHRQAIGTLGVVPHAFDVAAGTPLRATLVWTDYPASLLAATARVNELRLEVVDPSGAVWFQTLDATTGAPVQTADPADPHDGINVEERIVFEAPSAGRWIVRVVGVDVPMGPQPFALVVRGALTDCAAPGAPGPPSLTSPADGQVEVAWTPVPGAVAYNVYRGLGPCPAGAWIPIAVGVPGPAHLDTTVSGGALYRYRVVAVSDAQAACESPASPCASIVPTGECFLAPEFRGLATATSAGDAACAVDLSWNAAAPYCVGDVRYNVYRGTTSDFPVDAAHRVARCVLGTTHTDAVGLVHGLTYHYVVRAEDDATGHGGPCRGGNEDGNVSRVAAAPDGPAVSGTWTDDAGDTSAPQFQILSPWAIDPAAGIGGSMAYAGASAAGICSALTSPVLTLDAPGTGPQLSFATRHNLEYDPVGIFGAEGSLGQVEIAVGPTFSNWTRIPLIPDYPAFVEFPLNYCETTAALETYFSGQAASFTTHAASLANWAGGPVRLRFQLSGDLLYPGGSWWLDDIAVTEALVPGACTTAPGGPPPIPDGASVPGEPLRVAKDGSGVRLSWDATICPAAAINVYTGAIGNYATFTSGTCDLPPNGMATIAPAGDAWFVVVATDGSTTDGSFSRDAAGNELSYAGASAACSAIATHEPAGTCP